MDSVNKSIHADIDILLAKYVTGEADAVEVAQVLQWVSLSGQNKKQLEQLQIIWNKSETLSYTHAVDPQSAWQNFLARTAVKTSVPIRPKLFWRRLGYAAAVLLIAGISSAIYFWRFDKHSASNMLHDFSGDYIRTDTLPDGSIVELKPNSGLSYPSSFSASQRNISLTGDASFTVKHDPGRPFSVLVGDITVTVLGTSFDITSSLGRIEIDVKSGLVAITGRHQHQTLRANEKLIVPAMDSQWVKKVDTLNNTNLQVVQKPVVQATHEKPVKRLHDKSTHALMVGDMAPILPLDVWIKGGPLNVYDKRKVYLVDFWALWCGPCIAGMGRLSELQKKFKKDGLEVMSVTSEDEWGNSYEKVKRFIDSNSKRFDYIFAWLPLSYRADHKYRSIIYNSWLELAYDSSSWALPQVFLVDRNGKFAFIGDGYNLEEDLIKRVLDNSYDTAKERREYIEKLSLERDAAEFLSLLDIKDIRAAINLGRGIIENPLVTAHTLLVITDNLFSKYKDIQTNELIHLGFEAAKKGVSITGSQSPSHLATLAKAYSLLNEPGQAVKQIKSAINLSEGDYKNALEKDLKTYEEMTKK